MGYEYGNARLRAMRSRLLPRHEVIELAAAGSLTELIRMLHRTPYRRWLEVALVHTGDLESIYEALRRDFIDTAGKVRSFYDGDERRLVDLILRAYDIHNLKAVLRGLSHASPRTEIERALLPVGELSETILGELLRASSARGAIDLLATIRHPFAQPLLRLRAERPGADLSEFEQALDRWRFQEATQVLKDNLDGGERLLQALHLEADIANLLVVLRFIQSPGELSLARARLGREELDGLFAGTGSLPAERLNRLATMKTVRAVVDSLADVPFASALQAGARAYERSGRLSELEQALRRYQLNWQARLIARDPLGIGVVLGYLALKANEAANLRRIARGLLRRQDAETIRGELEFAL